MLVWFAQRRLLQEDVVYHENVQDFPFALLQEELGDFYIIRPEDSVCLCPSDYGQPYRRIRRLSILFHKRLVVARIDLTWAHFAERAGRERKCDFLCTSERMSRHWLLSLHEPDQGVALPSQMPTNVGHQGPARTASGTNASQIRSCRGSSSTSP